MKPDKFQSRGILFLWLFGSSKFSSSEVKSSLVKILVMVYSYTYTRMLPLVSIKFVKAEIHY